MKKILLVVAVALCSPALAQKEKAVPKSEWCSTVAYLAGAIMTSRQNEIELDELLKTVNGMGGKDGRVKDVANLMAEDAYSQQLYLTPAAKQREISEFKNKWQLTCLKSG